MKIMTEMGYRTEDIISSERVDTFKRGQLIGKTLIIHLPIPDTLNSYFDLVDLGENHEPATKMWNWIFGDSEE